MLFACIILVFALIPANLFYLNYQDTINQVIPTSAIGVAVVIYLILVGLIAVLALWVWWENRLVLTNKHVVQYTRLGIFNHSISQLNLTNVQDVTYSQRGVLANLLDYGDVVVETAGEQVNFVFRYVPDPEPIASQIVQAHEHVNDPTKTP